MIFIEASNFSKLLPKYLTDDDYRAFQFYLLRRPDAGSVVPGSGGIRKIRWKQTGKGKSGGVRIIYYWKKTHDEIWLLTIYSKSERVTLPSHILKRISEEIENE